MTAIPNEFTAGGRRWRISLTLGDLRRLRTDAGIDLLRLDERPAPEAPPLAFRLRTDPILVGEILWHCLADQIAAANLTEADFCRSMDGAALAGAFAALSAALLDFFHDLNRPDLVETVQTTARLVALATDQATKTLRALDLPTLTPGTTSPGSPPSPASSPGPGPSPNSRPQPTPNVSTNGNKLPASRTP